MAVPQPLHSPAERRALLLAQRAQVEADLAALDAAERREIDTLRDEARRSERFAYSVKEVSDLCGVSVMTVHRWLGQGLVCSRPGNGDKLITRLALAKFFDRWEI